MTTPEEVRAEIRARLESISRPRPVRDALQLSPEALAGDVSPLDDSCRRLGLHGLAAATNF